MDGSDGRHVLIVGPNLYARLKKYCDDLRLDEPIPETIEENCDDAEMEG